MGKRVNGQERILFEQYFKFIWPSPSSNGLGYPSCELVTSIVICLKVFPIFMIILQTGGKKKKIYTTILQQHTPAITFIKGLYYNEVFSSFTTYCK